MQVLVCPFSGSPCILFDEYIKVFPPLKQASSFMLSVHLITRQSDIPHFIDTLCLDTQRICKPAWSLTLHSLVISSSKIQMTLSYFHQRTASAYHQKADQDRTTHAYTIGQEMTVSTSMVKQSLINVGMMKAKLSLWGILNQ